MANRNEKNQSNAPGRWYVDSTCIDCDMCRGTAPRIFDRNLEIGMSVVIRQPVTSEEISLAQEAMDGCPSESIGNDATD